jgi:sugar O-acyltransferase (sialic acid O-acetyltransferase NeuD family)
MKELIFWGATGQARVLREALANSQFKLVAIFDNRPLPSPFADTPIYIGQEGFSSWLATRSAANELYACVAIGGTHGNERVAMQNWLQEQGVIPLTVVHSSAFVANDVKIGLGTQILAMSAVCANVKLGQAVIVNTAASIDHDCVISDGVHIGPGANLAGEVYVGEQGFIGTGAVILPRIRIGQGATVGAGAIVTRDVSPGQTVAGNPAKPFDS